MRMAVPAVLVLAATTAHANPRPFPFTYTTDSLPAGHVELEQYADLVSMRAFVSSSDKETYLASAFQTEIEIGLCDRLELGLELGVGLAVIAAGGEGEKGGGSKQLRHGVSC